MVDQKDVAADVYVVYFYVFLSPVSIWRAITEVIAMRVCACCVCACGSWMLFGNVGFGFSLAIPQLRHNLCEFAMRQRPRAESVTLASVVERRGDRQFRESQ